MYRSSFRRGAKLCEIQPAGFGKPYDVYIGEVYDSGSNMKGRPMMSILNKIKWMVIGILLLVLLEVLAIALLLMGGANRPPAPPAHATVTSPWGAILASDATDIPALQESMTQSILEESAEEFDTDGNGVRTYDILSLSGGGAKGAFGSGLLCGWSETGTRPTFKVVTGVSTGALQATPAFLGEDYDWLLKEIFTAHDTSSIFERRPLVGSLSAESIADSAPLRGLIEHYMTQDLLDAVAAEHAKGRRLFVGTMNMDRGEFVIWDMGAIASSGRADALEHYRNIMLASCSAQVFLPPVYFEVTDEAGNTYGEMHADAATFSQAFFRGCLIEFDDALAETGMDLAGAQANLYVVINGKLVPSDADAAVKPRAISIGAATMEQLFQVRSEASIYRMYVLSHRYGLDFHLTAVPDDCAIEMHMLDFDPPKMQALFDVGYAMALEGDHWMDDPPHVDPEELFRPED